MLPALTFALCGLIAAGLLYHLGAAFCVWEFFRTDAARARPSSRLPPLSVLKPVKGIEPAFRENLESFLMQDYPGFEVVIGFSERDKAAADDLRQQPGMSNDPRVRVITSAHDLGPNRKVSNLQGLVEAARHPLLVLSDSDMRAGPRYLRTITEEYEEGEKVGMVTNLYKVSEPRSLGAALESLTIALDLIPSVLAARRLEGVSFGLGASMMISKKALEETGGLGPVASYLADDYQIGNRLSKRGYTIVLSREVLETVPGPMTLREYAAHQLRWARTYRASRPKGFAGYGIAHVLPFALGLLLLRGPDNLTLFALGLVAAVRTGGAALVEARVIRSKRWFIWLPLLPLKDVMSFCIWAWSFVGSTVTWRGSSFRVLKDGRIREKA